jgi:hypothetical protein
MVTMPLKMNIEQRGLPLRSNPETYSHGNGITFKMDFLAQARHMAAPEVYEIDVVFTGSVGGVTATALGRDAAKLFDTIKFRDSDDVWTTSGAGARVLEQLEVGAKQTDPSTVASGATNASYVYRLRMLFAPPHRAERPRDFAIPISNFLDGGEFTINTAAAVPTGWNTIQSDWKIQLFAFVVDGRNKELKSRRRVKEEALSSVEFDYQINGSVRAAIVTSKLTTTGHTDLSGYATLNSRSLRWPAAYQAHNLVDDYRINTEHYGTNDEFLAAAPGALAIVAPEKWQKTGAMPDFKSLHLDLLTAAPAGGRLLTDTVIDRNPDMGALQMGYDSPSALAMAVKQYGHVVGAAGNYPVRAFNSQLARRLPIRIDPSR